MNPKPIVAIPNQTGKKLEMILQNYLSNAIKFTPPGGQIKMIFNHDDEHLIWEVCDSGPGIPEDQLDKVFMRYYQVSSAGADLGGTRHWFIPGQRTRPTDERKSLGRKQSRHRKSVFRETALPPF